MADDDKHMNLTDIAAGAVGGAVVGTGIAAIHGATTLGSERPVFKVAVADRETIKRCAGLVKDYRNASWYEKPLIAFESMSTKGKVGVGAVAVAAAIGTALAVNHLRDNGEKSFTERLANERNASTNERQI